jgi:hypothetical protein
MNNTISDPNLSLPPSLREGYLPVSGGLGGLGAVGKECIVYYVNND